MRFEDSLSLNAASAFQIQTRFDAASMTARFFGAKDIELKDRKPLASAAIALVNAGGAYPMVNYDKESAHYPVKMDADALYDAFAAAGYTATGPFRNIREMRLNGNEAVAVLETPPVAAGYDFHPAVLDGIFQALLAIPAAAGALGIPAGFTELRVLKPLAGTLYCHARLDEGDGKTRAGTVEAYTDKGEAVAILTGLQIEIHGRTKTAEPGAGNNAPAGGDDIVKTLCVIYADALEQPVKDIPLDQNLADTGVDSLGTYLISTDIQDKLGVDIAPEKLAKVQTFGDLVNYVREHK
jgi:acyl carrier protein